MDNCSSGHINLITADISHEMNGNGSISTTQTNNCGSERMDNSSSCNLGTVQSQTGQQRGRSKVWNEFVVTTDGKKVTCRQCGDSLSYSHSHSTSSMLKHLKRKHNMDLYPPIVDEDSMAMENNSAGSAIGARPAEKVVKKYSKTKKAPANNVGFNKCDEEVFEQKLEPEPSSSVQHDPLVFTDPCIRMRWADHSDTVLKSFSVMYNDEFYTDCTIVAEKQFFKGHRMILSSASELLDEMFKMTPQNQHPIIFLNNVQAMELRILLDFIYKGEVAIPPSHIPGLVKVGGELRVRGLSDFVWNDQLASSIFHGFPTNNSPQFSQAQPIVHEATFINTHNTQGQKLTQQSNIVPARVSVVSKPHQISNAQQMPTTYTYVTDKPVQSGFTVSQSPSRTYARLSSSVLSNIRSLNVIPSQQSLGVIQNDSNSVDNSGATEYKRIRLVTTGTPIATQKSNCYQTKYTTSTGDIGMDCQPIPETVLMVSNQGDTLLSTSQGGVTLMAPNSISLPMNISVKNEPTLESSGNHSHQFHDEHPITILSSCGTSDSHDLEEVVYSITEVPGGGHEVLVSGSNDSMSSESIVMYSHSGESTCESQDKKPFLQSLHKS